MLINAFWVKGIWIVPWKMVTVAQAWLVASAIQFVLSWVSWLVMCWRFITDNAGFHKIQWNHKWLWLIQPDPNVFLKFHDINDDPKILYSNSTYNLVKRIQIWCINISVFVFNIYLPFNHGMFWTINYFRPVSHRMVVHPQLHKFDSKFVCHSSEAIAAGWSSPVVW